MSVLKLEQRYSESPIAALVKTTLCQTRLSGLSNMLKSVAKALNAYGCILWEIAPGSELDKDSPKGFLFVLAQWFEDHSICAIHDLPIVSITGESVLSQECLNIPDIWTDPRIYLNDPFLSEAGIKAMCSIPITFRDGRDGAINFYRNCSLPFTGDDIAQAKELSSMIAVLYGTVRDQVSLNLIRRVNAVLHQTELRASDESFGTEEMKRAIQGICDIIADTFQCIEASIFFKNTLENPNIYKLVATTWPWLELFWKSSYEKDDPGLTGWVLTHGRPVRIFDLAHFERDQSIINREYPNLIWTDSLKLESAIRKHLDLDPKKKLQPLSFMAVPIEMGEEIIGVIRCAAAKEGPYYFADREVDLLSLIAALIGQYWTNWLNKLRVQDEVKSWQALIESISTLNSFVHDNLMEVGFSEKQVFEKALKAINAIIKGAEIIDIRLLDKEKGELYFACAHGDAWYEGGDVEQQERLARRFPVSGILSKSAGAHVVQTGKSYLMKDVLADPYYAKIFPHTTQMIVAPIKVEENTIGVLDIRLIETYSLPEHAVIIADILGQQLGLYHQLINGIDELRRAQADLNNNLFELEKRKQQQTQVFKDLGHQLKSPINQSYMRVNSALREEYTKLRSILKSNATTDKFQSTRLIAKLRLNLVAARGLCGKARRVAASTRLFADLARGECLHPNFSRLLYDDLVKLLIEAATDNRVLVSPSSGISFFVSINTLRVLRYMNVFVDMDLLEQAINTILDNAGKYSFDKSKVRISGGKTQTGEFYISVSNKGIPILPKDIEMCTVREWRSEAARATTGEGSGIGLWIVKHIMEAHKGELRIIPTTNANITEVRLTFPCS